MPRIASLLPSATEIVAALGFQADLVGRSHECDYPEGISSLPILTHPAFATEVSSREIDRNVKGLLEKSLSLYEVDVDALKSLRPDIIVTQSQCEVCAVSESELQRALTEWVEGSARILSLKPNRLEDVWQDIQAVATFLGAPERGESLLRDLRTRVEAVKQKTPAIDSRPRVACIEWLEPLMAAGNWIPELVEMAGGQNLFGKVGEHSPWMDEAELKAGDPEVIVLMPCGFSMERTQREISVLAAQPYWKELSAVKNRRVYLTDGNQYFNRSGPRLADSLEILAEILHPGIFGRGYRGLAWEILD